MAMVVILGFVYITSMYIFPSTHSIQEGKNRCMTPLESGSENLPCDVPSASYSMQRCIEATRVMHTYIVPLCSYIDVVLDFSCMQLSCTC